jgi:hypothetical protein
MGGFSARKAVKVVENVEKGTEKYYKASKNPRPFPKCDLQYTLSIITSQLHCFQLRTTLNGKDFKFFLMGYAQRSRTSFFNTCAKKKILDFDQ